MTAPLSRPAAVLFDWDNTLVDTWPVIHDAMNETLSRMGQPQWTLDETRARVRRSMRETFPDMFGERWHEARDIFYRRFGDIHLERLAVRPGAAALLECLAGKGIWLGVVSNKMGDHLRSEATHLGWSRYFGRIVGATDAARDKPASEPVVMALDGSGVSPGESVWFVGDTEIDMECAYNANCIAILVRETPISNEEFRVFQPHSHFSGCGALNALASGF